MLENARLIFRNFSGKQNQYNPTGQRNFSILLDEETGKKLKKDGWNVKWLKPRDEGDPDQAILPVKVKYGGKPPKICTITSSGMTVLDQFTIHTLDWASISFADILISPYNWEVGGRKGTAAYVKTMYVTLEEDELEKKYSHIPASIPQVVHDQGVPESNRLFDSDEPPF